MAVDSAASTASLPTTGDLPPAPPRPIPRQLKGGLPRLVSSLTRLLDIQYHIWLLHAKITLQRMVLYVALFGVAILLGLLAIIFLYIGAFHLLTDIAGLRPVWAYLIFGGFHIALAAALVIIGTAILGKKDDGEKAVDKDKYKDRRVSQEAAP